jgi:hypothetical protein
MKWYPAKRYHQVSAAGYSVCVARVGERLVYSAWAPPDRPALSHWKWVEARSRAHYARGEHVPQRREHLGCAGSPEQARTLCERHYADLHPELARLQEAAA